MDERTRAKIDFVSAGKPEHARLRLTQLADPSQLPRQYGGTGPPLADLRALQGFDWLLRVDTDR